MSVLPSGSVDLQSVRTVKMPSRTWALDFDSGKISGECDELAAVKQAAMIILRTERFREQIYSASSGLESRDLIGNDPGYVAAELRNRIEEALTADDRITGIEDYTHEISGDSITATFSVNSIYGRFDAEVNV